jgi:hypothetical protein
MLSKPIDKPEGARSGFFSNLIDSFRVSFYRKTAKLPLTQAFLHVAGLTAILAIAASWALHTREQELVPHFVEFYQKGVPDDLYFADGKIEYDGPNPYVYSSEVLGGTIAMIIDTTGSTQEIPPEYSMAILITDEKMFHGDSVRKDEIKLPDERVKAKDFFIRQTGKQYLPVHLMRWANYFTTMFALAAVIIAVTAAAIHALLGRRDPKLGFKGQIVICCFASTPLFAGGVAIHGIGGFYAAWTVLGISSVLFILLAVLGTREFLAADRSAADHALNKGDGE